MTDPNAVAVACPTWCGLPAGHPFDSWVHAPADLFRTHERTFGAGQAAVTVQLGESAASARGPIDPYTEPPTVWVNQGELTADGARALARNLLAAADMCTAAAAAAACEPSAEDR